MAQSKQADRVLTHDLLPYDRCANSFDAYLDVLASSLLLADVMLRWPPTDQSLLHGCAGPNVRQVLIVEDDYVTRMAMTSLLRSSGYAATGAASAEEALVILRQGKMPRVVLVDLDLPGMNGLELIREMRSADPSIVPILVTAAGHDAVLAAVESARLDYLQKPVNLAKLIAMMDARSSSRPSASGHGLSA